MLHVTLSVKHGIRDENLERLFERIREKVVERLNGECLDQVSLHAEVELSSHRREGMARLTLDLPGGALHADARGRSHLQALRMANDALLSELKTRRRKDRERERDATTIRPVNGHSADIGVGDSTAKIEPDLAQRVAETMPELHSFVRREIALHAEDGLTASPPIESDDVVDEALLQALATHANCPDDVPFDRYVFSCAFDVILAEIERRRNERQADSLESEISTNRSFAAFDTLCVLDSLQETDAASDDAMDGAMGDSPAMRIPRTLGEALADDRARAGDVELVGRDLRYAVMSAIRHLPLDERRALSLVAFQGLPVPEAGRRMQRSPLEVTTLMEQARIDVRRELLAKGY